MSWSTNYNKRLLIYHDNKNDEVVYINSYQIYMFEVVIINHINLVFLKKLLDDTTAVC